jgi:hypothetical protein
LRRLVVGSDNGGGRLRTPPKTGGGGGRLGKMVAERLKPVVLRE